MMDREQLRALSNEREWCGKLEVVPPRLDQPHTRYELHPTGDADLNGRTYVALPIGTRLSDEVRRRHNLI